MDSLLDDPEDSWFIALMDFAAPSWNLEAKGSRSDVWGNGFPANLASGGMGSSNENITDYRNLAEVADQGAMLSARLDATEHVAGRYRSTREQAESNGSSSLSAPKSEEDSKKEIQYECTACTDTFPDRDIVRFPCNHYYCAKCTAELFESAAKDESRFPPKCCGKKIPLSVAAGSLTSVQILRFKRKSVEYTTLDRTYCSSEGCSTFIEPSTIEGDIATCGQCCHKTCVKCKCKSHEGECPEDIALDSLVKKAREKGWQRCFKCKRMVERVSGCNHMRYETLLVELARQHYRTISEGNLGAAATLNSATPVAKSGKLAPADPTKSAATPMRARGPSACAATSATLASLYRSNSNGTWTCATPRTAKSGSALTCLR
ncbi:hypothetical protein GP486_006880, partial [Trichoglossum hirsutum]